VLLTLFLDAKARYEERWLLRQFPEYAGYSERVRRFVPLIY
jgi:protein-S-isoprenylcysteine O-methyltransferase Ste14